MSSAVAMVDQPITDKEKSLPVFDLVWSYDFWEEEEEEDDDDRDTLLAPQQQQQQQEELPPQQQQQSSLSPSFPAMSSFSSSKLHKVSSCYFSVQSSEAGSDSVADLLSILEETFEEANETMSLPSPPVHPEEQDETTTATATTREDSSISPLPQATTTPATAATSSCGVLYPDIVLHIFTYLDVNDLAACSETSQSFNHQVANYLTFHLQQVLHRCEQGGKRIRKNPCCNSLQGMEWFLRLATLNRAAAERILREFRKSPNSAATTHHGLSKHTPLSSLSPRQQAAGAAALILTTTMIGAASFLSASHHYYSPGGMAVSSSSELFYELVSELMASMEKAASIPASSHHPELNVLVMGLVGSVLGAARMASKTTSTHGGTLSSADATIDRGGPENDNDDDGNSNTGSNPAVLGWQTSRHFLALRDLMRRMQDAAYEAASTARGSSAVASSERRTSALDESESSEQAGAAAAREEAEEEKYNEGSNDDKGRYSKSRRNQPQPPVQGPSGCVGAYFRAIQHARAEIFHKVKSQRRQRFEQLPMDERSQYTTAFLDACTNDDSLPIVKEMIHAMDVEGFYLGSDGTETCALHAAAFNGAVEVLEFLCRGVVADGDELDGNDRDDHPSDGGLCNINLTDANGWTALHFAVGANSVRAVQILCRFGADWTVEANNGYTPLQWAVRLQQDAVAEELRIIILQDNRIMQKHNHGSRWMVTAAQAQPFSVIANRFLAMIPTRS